MNGHIIFLFLLKMKTILFACILTVTMSCGGPTDQNNSGAQADQDYPSNKDRDVSNDKSDAANGAQSMQERQDTNTLHQRGEGQAGQGTPPNQAPNNGSGNPQENIHGQTGTNQTGQGDTSNQKK